MTQLEAVDDEHEHFESTTLQHLDSLYRLALYLTHRTEDAEDLVQETYLRAFEHFDQYRQSSNCRAWLFKILRTSFIDHYHKNKQMHQVDLETIAPSYSGDWSDAALIARLDMDGSAFRVALGKLPEEARTMLFLAYVEGFTYEEIAQVMNCPVGTVMSRLSRARHRIRDHLSGQSRARKAGMLPISSFRLANSTFYRV